MNQGQALADMMWLISRIPVAYFQPLLGLLTLKILKAAIMDWLSIGHVHFGKTSHYLLPCEFSLSILVHRVADLICHNGPDTVIPTYIPRNMYARKA